MNKSKLIEFWKSNKGWIFITLCVVALAVGRWTNRYITSLKHDYEVAVNNTKSLENRIAGNEKDIIAYQTTISNMTHSNDSLMKVLRNKQKQLGIKDKELQSALSMQATYSTVDTVVLYDTIFREPDFVLDTNISDQWRNTHIYLKYPSTIQVDGEMRSNRSVFVTTQRETIDPPKKCWIGRLFQKKHTIARVKIDEENPYLTTEQNVYIQILE